MQMNSLEFTIQKKEPAASYHAVRDPCLLINTPERRTHSIQQFIHKQSQDALKTESSIQQEPEIEQPVAACQKRQLTREYCNTVPVTGCCQSVTPLCSLSVLSTHLYRGMKMRPRNTLCMPFRDLVWSDCRRLA